VPCSAALVVAISFVSAVVGVLLVVPVTVSAWLVRVVARRQGRNQSRLVRCCRGFSRAIHSMEHPNGGARVMERMEGWVA
jgi:hypothetical protein